MNTPMKYEDVVAKLDAALGREAALRERLNFADQRADELEGLLREWRHGHGMTLKECASLRDRTDVALKPAAWKLDMDYRPEELGSPETEPAAQHQGGVTLEQVLKAYDYANAHPHKYLRGTTNWCAAVAHSLNIDQPAPVAPKSACTSCDGSGEYTDAIGRWMGYCKCPAGIESKDLKGTKP